MTWRQWKDESGQRGKVTKVRRADDHKGRRPGKPEPVQQRKKTGCVTINRLTERLAQLVKKTGGSLLLSVREDL